MNLVVAVDENWAIGKNGQLLIRNGYDLAHFKDLTKGNVIIYGRKTLETFPKKEPLEERTNIILTHDRNFTVDGATVVHNIDELNKVLEKFPTHKVFVCGGASIYEQLLSRCKIAYVTHFKTAVPGADAFFPNLKKKPNWHMVKGKNEPLEVTYPSKEGDKGKPMTMLFATWVNDDVD